MPELPEVETMRRDLQRAVGLARLTAVEVLDAKVIVGPPEAFTERLQGRQVVDYGRRGKILMLHLDSTDVLLVHPRMTGRFVLLAAGEPLSRFARVVFALADGRRLVYDDTRRFGRLELARSGEEEAGQLLGRIGPDATACAPARLAPHLRRRSIAVKAFLLDQTVLAGVGNIYASEICFRCGLDPRTPCRTLTAAEVRELAAQTQRVLAEGIALRGTTIATYTRLGGRTGGFQARLAVYGREGEKCLRAGCRGTIQKVVLSGRSTYYCSQCQRKGRRRQG